MIQLKKKGLNKESYNLNVYKLLRLCNDLSVSEVATEIGISQQYLRDIEKGYRNPARDKFLLLLDVYNISEETFNDIVECQKMYKNEQPLKHYQKVLMHTLNCLL